MTEKIYHDEKNYGEILFCISSMVQKILDRVRDSRFFGIMIDESTDISVICHLIVFASFVKEGRPLCIFIELLHIEEENINKNHEIMRLDLNKCVKFGSNGASTMIGKQNRLVARLKNKINHFLSPFIVWYRRLTQRL